MDLWQKILSELNGSTTSKTYSANEIARTLCLHKEFQALKEDTENKIEWFKKHLNQKHRFEDQIFRLQLHANYTYQDFVGGLQIKGDSTVAKPGDLYDVIDRAKDIVENPNKNFEHIKSNSKLPIVLILDEINRTDLSAMFGEVFSALEKREEDKEGITVSVPFEKGDSRKKLTIPENIYVIGTMNEIDFSLERLDFAMRRRFLWFFYGYDEQRLRDILTFKLKQEENKGLEDKGYENFIEMATDLNDAISDDKEYLGKNYQIGHTFFSEIVDIKREYEKNLSGSQRSNIYKNNGPADILWDISIKPMIEAFLGALESEEKEKKVKEFYDIYQPAN